jgi:glycosyltransferase involved in cell wall biosynthesis
LSDAPRSGRAGGARSGIVFVLPTLAIGGSERHFSATASSLARDGLAVTVAALLRGGPLEDDLRACGVSLEVLGLSGMADPRALPRLVGLFARRRPAVVQACLFGFDAVAALPARLTRVPLVLGARREIATWMRPRHRRVEAVGTALCHRVVCCSAAVRDHAMATERGPAERYVVIHNGVDLARFRRPSPEERAGARAGLRLAAGERAVVTVGNFAPAKGHEVLLAAASRIMTAIPGATFLWAGEGPSQDALAAEAARRELPVRLLGSIPDVARLLAAADLFVLPSLSEGLPNALLEAMASGVPAVATAVGGVPELTGGDGEGGALLVAAADAEELATAAIRILRDPQLGVRLGQAGRSRAEAFGSGESVAAYRRLCHPWLEG